ncbi:riboflavin synthase subunit alpha [Litoribrevibacter albus]|uniref:Riboflavin synthase n=1 Tax=Litoribrevibacter albus TaxID=1473156 RepID=A0AA37SAK0_9GAMM|nr:riboflavin synthase subunit alpha [Litoribrevibacter albus]GLQ31824.1 riboflavin synthase subunit alpha [Litoribrevibacter albus]
MFTGIVANKFPVVEIIDKDQLRRTVVELTETLVEGLKIGASVANNGVCLTVVKIDGVRVHFDIIDETLRLTNLGELNVGDKVNIERAAAYGDEIGGHVVSGHICDTVEITEIRETATNTAIYLQADPKWGKYLMPKGFVSLNGCSLTIGEEVEQGRFSIHLIPETLQVTTFGDAKVGDKINLEIDPSTQTIVDTVERYLAERSV